MWHIGYVSVAEGKWDEKKLADLERQAVENNTKNQVTGLLVFDGSHFFQYLEGSDDAVMPLYQSIERDPRHSSVTLLSSEAVKERLFAKWAMKLFLPKDFNLEDRVHILDLLSQKHEKESIPTILKSLRFRSVKADL